MSMSPRVWARTLDKYHAPGSPYRRASALFHPRRLYAYRRLQELWHRVLHIIRPPTARSVIALSPIVAANPLESFQHHDRVSADDLIYIAISDCA